MDAATTVEVVGGEGGAGNSGGGDMAASVTSIMENSKDAMAELFQDEAEVGNQNHLKLPWKIKHPRRQEDKMEEPILLIQDTPNRFGSSNPQERVENKVLNQANAGYEIPARLRTLHNLVIQYASQGR